MAAQAGTLTMVGKQSGRTFAVDLYVPDAVATNLTFNPGGLAGTGSPATYRVPEDVVIIDVSVGAAPTAVGAALQVNGAVANGGAIRWANQLSTLANRQKLALPVNKGDFIAFLQF